MSEDEIKPTEEEYYMERVNALLEVLNQREFFEYIGDGDYYSVGVTGLLDLYQLEKEKNEKLVDKTIQYDKTLEKLQKDTIWKDKIRAKIKELEEKSVYWNCDEIEVLKELLGG